jgi:hypothetical protein
VLAAHLWLALVHCRYDYASNLGSPWSHTLRVIDYVRVRYPFWNESAGADHLVWHAGDLGSCVLDADESALERRAGNVMRLGHFCYHGRYDLLNE